MKIGYDKNFIGSGFEVPIPHFSTKTSIEMNGYH